MDLVPIGTGDFEVWAEGVRDRLAVPRIGTRAWPASAAHLRAAELMAKLLPAGLSSPGHHVYAARDGGVTSGYVWMRVEDADAFVFDVGATTAPIEKLLAAAEESALELGAEVLRLNVFAGDVELRAAVGDFEVSVSQMRLWLDRRDPTVGGADISLRDMSPDEFARFLPIQEAEYTEGLFRSRLARSLDEARARAIAENDESLPNGVGSDGQILRTAWADGNPVGTIWLELSEGADGPYAFVNDLYVHPKYRRRGYGRAIMVAAEQDCRRRGVVVLGLSVFGFNDAARSLYEQIGYEITEQMVWRDLRRSGGSPPSHGRAATV